MSSTELVIILHAIVAESTIDSVGEENCLNWGTLEERHSLVQNAANMATRVLIEDDGERNLQAECDLSMAGFYVFCLEKDSAGWLVGGIQTEKGVIAYG